MTKTVNEREIVLGILIETVENGQYSHIVLRDVLANRKERLLRECQKELWNI